MNRVLSFQFWCHLPFYVSIFVCVCECVGLALVQKAFYDVRLKRVSANVLVRVMRTTTGQAKHVQAGSQASFPFFSERRGSTVNVIYLSIICGLCGQRQLLLLQLVHCAGTTTTTTTTSTANQRGAHIIGKLY